MPVHHVAAPRTRIPTALGAGAAVHRRRDVHSTLPANSQVDPLGHGIRQSQKLTHGTAQRPPSRLAGCDPCRVGAAVMPQPIVSLARVLARHIVTLRDKCQVDVHRARRVGTPTQSLWPDRPAHEQTKAVRVASGARVSALLPREAPNHSAPLCVRAGRCQEPTAHRGHRRASASYSGGYTRRAASAHQRRQDGMRRTFQPQTNSE